MTNGWETTTIGESCTIVSGGTPSKKNASYWSGERPWVSAKDLKFDQINSASRHISQKAVDQSATKIAPVGSLLILVRGMGLANGVQIGEVTSPVAFNQDLRAIVPPACVSPRFLLLAIRHQFLTSGERLLTSAAHGTLKIDSEALRDIRFPLPPLTEQKRLVHILDEAFAGIAPAMNSAELNLRNARALFESHIQSVFRERGQGWVNAALGELCESFSDGDWVESKDQSPSGIRLIQTGNIGEGFFKGRSDKARYVSEQTFNRLRCTEVFEGDCLISRLPDPVGRSCIVPFTGERMITAVDCTIVRFRQARLLPQFFNHYSQSVEYLSAVGSKCTGTTRNRISRSNLALISIPVPPFADQRRVVSELDAMRHDTRRLESIYQRKLVAFESLKTSLLHQAFSGRV